MCSVFRIVFYIVSPHVYSYLFSLCVKFTDHCHQVENQLQLKNILSRHIIKSLRDIQHNTVDYSKILMRRTP
jgi:hypothetical protein